MKQIQWAMWVIVILGLVACGEETNREVIERFTPQYSELRTELADIANNLPSAEEVTGTNGPYEPLPQYTEGAEAVTNTDFLMYDQLLNPNIDPYEVGQLDFLMSNHLGTLLQWAGPENPMSERAMEQTAPENRGDQFEQTLNLNYLGVIRIVEFIPAAAIDIQTFSGATAVIEGFLVDMEDHTVLCAFTISADAGQDVYFNVQEDEDPTEQLALAANSSLWTNARQKFIATMNENCRVQFVLEE
jgi:hypothetical protein